MKTFVGILYLLDRRMIGRWKWFRGSLRCTLKERGMEARIQFVGFHLKGKHLKLSRIIRYNLIM
jgi:hypothetical protein